MLEKQSISVSNTVFGYGIQMCEMLNYILIYIRAIHNGKSSKSIERKNKIYRQKEQDKKIEQKYHAQTNTPKINKKSVCNVAHNIGDSKNLCIQLSIQHMQCFGFFSSGNFMNGYEQFFLFHIFFNFYLVLSFHSFLSHASPYFVHFILFF